jgi:polyisoprenoid-binding protein YceI
MKKKLYSLITFSCFGVIVLFSVIWFRAETYILTNSTIKITGTSTLKDWESISKEASGEAEIEIDKGTLKKIHSLTLRIPSESLKSGNNQMDRNTYDALKTGEHPHIVFDLQSVEEIAPLSAGKHVVVRGNLTIAGVTNPIILAGNGSVSNKIIAFQGSHPLKMTDFNIEPPTALLGTVRAHDEIQIHFNVSYGPKNQVKS